MSWSEWTNVGEPQSVEMPDGQVRVIDGARDGHMFRLARAGAGVVHFVAAENPAGPDKLADMLFEPEFSRYRFSRYRVRTVARSETVHESAGPGGPFDPDKRASGLAFWTASRMLPRAPGDFSVSYRWKLELGRLDVYRSLFTVEVQQRWYVAEEMP